MMKKRANNFIDITDLVFNRLKAIELAYVKNKTSYWKFLCNCGNICIKNGAHVRRGLTKSCGCLSLERKRLKKGESGFNRLFSEYQRGAKNRNLNFTLTKEDFKKITKENCHYCKTPPTQKSVAKSRNSMEKRAIEYSEYLYNGIDRKDNKKGYTLENSVPCCYICNRAKSGMSYLNFKLYIKNIVKNYTKDRYEP